MKRPLSLLEVAIGLALTAILLTALFSSFRQIIQSGVKVEAARTEMHGWHLLDLRLNQIFESLSDGKLFYTSGHNKARGEALYFTFNNGLEQNPEFCGEMDGVLYASNEKNPSLCLLLKDQREEIFIDQIDHLSFQFFDPQDNEWHSSWNKKTLPPMTRIKIDDRVYSYILPKVEHKVIYP